MVETRPALYATEMHTRHKERQLQCDSNRVVSRASYETTVTYGTKRTYSHIRWWNVYCITVSCVCVKKLNQNILSHVFWNHLAESRPLIHWKGVSAHLNERLEHQKKVSSLFTSVVDALEHLLLQQRTGILSHDHDTSRE